jgi:phosphotransferase system  glucose/maltose/N-acetylglucosamine-specific IIC component
MDDRITDRMSGKNLVPIVRLVSLMLVGVLASLIAMPARMGRGPKDLVRDAQANIAYTATGAISGLLVELLIRWRERK